MAGDRSKQASSFPLLEGESEQPYRPRARTDDSGGDSMVMMRRIRATDSLKGRRHAGGTGSLEGDGPLQEPLPVVGARPDVGGYGALEVGRTGRRRALMSIWRRAWTSGWYAAAGLACLSLS